MIQDLHFDALGNVFNMGFDDVTTIHGKDGVDGKDGISPTAKVEETTEGVTIIITDATGTTRASVKNGRDSNLAYEAVIETVLEGLTEKIRITSLSIVGAYTGWQIYADGRPLSENIIPICESFVTVAGVMNGLTAGFFQNDKEIVRCKMNVTEHGSVKYVNFSDYERISEKHEIEYIQKKMVGVHFGRLNSSATGAVTLTDIPDNSLILLASGEGLKLNAKGQSDTLSATAKHLVLWTGSTRDHEVYGTTDKRMTYLVYTQDMSLTNLKPYNIYTAYTKTKADAVDGDTGISIVCPVHTYIGVIGAEFPK